MTIRRNIRVFEMAYAGFASGNHGIDAVRSPQIHRRDRKTPMFSGF